MDGETWMSANMAINLGFADELLFTGSDANTAPAPDPVTVEDGYAYSCRTVSNKLLARIAAKMHKAVVNEAPTPPVTTPPQPLEEQPSAPPDPPAPLPLRRRPLPLPHPPLSLLKPSSRPRRVFLYPRLSGDYPCFGPMASPRPLPPFPPRPRPPARSILDFIGGHTHE